MTRRVIVPLLLFPLLGVLAPATATADTQASITCRATGSIALYTDETRTTLVDYFTFTEAPTRHVVGSGSDPVDTFTIQGEQGPGVEVTGAITGTAYVFRFRLVAVGKQTPSGVVTQITTADWRVTEVGGGIVADSRNQSVRVFSQDGLVVDEFFGPTQNGLFLSGFLGIRC
jgi:hypothetical protein